MKIVIINGSPRKNGATAKILKYIEEILITEEHENCKIDFINVNECDIQTCIGCSACFKIGKCLINDEGNKIASKISNADAVIIGSPVYASNVTGVLKNFIDRGNFVMGQLLCNKKVFNIVTYENAGASSTLKILNQLSIFSGGAVSAKLKIKNKLNENPMDNKQNCNKIIKETIRFKLAILKDKSKLTERIIHMIVFNVGIKPFAIKNNYILERL